MKYNWSIYNQSSNLLRISIENCMRIHYYLLKSKDYKLKVGYINEMSMFITFFIHELCINLKILNSVSTEKWSIRLNTDIKWRFNYA